MQMPKIQSFELGSKFYKVSVDREKEVLEYYLLAFLPNIYRFLKENYGYDIEIVNVLWFNWERKGNNLSAPTALEP